MIFSDSLEYLVNMHLVCNGLNMRFLCMLYIGGSGFLGSSLCRLFNKNDISYTNFDF